MKRSRWLKPRVLIFFGLTLGICLGYIFGNTIEPNGKKPALTPEPPPNQRRLLFVGVDRVGMPGARLQGVWFVAFVPGRRPITFLPVYPAPLYRDRRENHTINVAFQINDDGRIDSKFFAAIDNVYGLHDFDTIVLDDIAMMQVVDFFEGVELGGKLVSGPWAIGSLTPPWRSLEDALNDQTTLLTQLCNRASFEKTSRNIQQIMDLMPEHLVADIEVNQAIDEWLGLLSSGPHLHCEFPFLEMETP